MHVLLVSAYGLPHMGGIEAICDELARRLSAGGHEVTHVTSTAGAGEDERTAPYRLVRVAAANGLERRLGVPYPLFSPRLVAVLRRELARADVVHAHGFIYPGTIAAFALAGRTRSRPGLVLTEHVGHVPYDSPPLNAVQAVAIRTLGRACLRRADAVITYNDRVAAQIEALSPGVERVTILNGVDHDLFHPSAPGERERLRAALGWDERPRALFVGRPVAKKGFPVALAALASTRGEAVLAVAGAGELPAGTPPEVEVLGPLPRERLAEVYRAADLLLAPARGEGFPLAMQEALASGLPLLIAADPGYAPNLAGAGHAVRQVAAGGDFATALADLLADPTALAEASAAAASHARRAFSWPRAIAEHEALYLRVTTKKFRRQND